MAKTRFAAPWHTLLSRLRKNTHCLGVMHFLNRDCNVGTFLERSQNHFQAHKLVRPIGKSVEKITEWIAIGFLVKMRNDCCSTRTNGHRNANPDNT